VRTFKKKKTKGPKKDSSSIACLEAWAEGESLEKGGGYSGEIIPRSNNPEKKETAIQREGSREEKSVLAEGTNKSL